MADSDTQLEEDAGSALGKDENQNASIKQSPLRTLVVGGPGFNLNGNFVRVTELPSEARAKKLVGIEGEHFILLDREGDSPVFDEVWVKFGDQRKLVTRLSAKRGNVKHNLVSFIFPDLDYVLKQDDPVKLQLVSKKYPEVSAEISQSLKYKTLESQQKEFENFQEKESRLAPGLRGQSNGQKSETQPGTVSRMADQAFNSGAGVIAGIVNAANPVSPEVRENRDKLKAALKSGDRKAVSSAVEQLRRQKDTEGLKASLSFSGADEFKTQITASISALESGSSRKGSERLSVETSASYRGGNSAVISSYSQGQVGGAEIEEQMEEAQVVNSTIQPGQSQGGKAESSFQETGQTQISDPLNNQDSSIVSIESGSEFDKENRIKADLSSTKTASVFEGLEASENSSAQVVAEYAEGNPNALLGLSGNPEIMAKLKKGELNSLNEEQKDVLKSSIEAESSAPGTKDKTVKEALGKVGVQVGANTLSKKSEKDSKEDGISVQHPELPEELSKEGSGEVKRESEVPESKEYAAEIERMKKGSEALNISLGGVLAPAEKKPGQKVRLAQDIGLRSKTKTDGLSAEIAQNRKGTRVPAEQQSFVQNESDTEAYEEGSDEDLLRKPQALTEADTADNAGQGEKTETDRLSEQPEKTEDLGSPKAVKDQKETKEKSQGANDGLLEEIVNHLPNKFDSKAGINYKLATTKLIKQVNKLVNSWLLRGAIWIWSLAIPSFGLSILIGAIVGNVIWIFKGWLISRAVNIVMLGKSGYLRKGINNLGSRIKFSWAVKINIIAWNLLVLLLVILIMSFFVATLKWACDGPVAKGTSWVLGYDGLCSAVENMGSGSYFDFVSSKAVEPIGPLTTQKWNEQISSISGRYGIDACILKVVVQKESGGQENIIGCDCAANGHPERCPEGSRGPYTPAYRFNWEQCSYGIGLTQWTIFPQSRVPWCGVSASRALYGVCYTVQDFLNPSTSLDLTAKSFAANMQAFARSQGRSGPPFTRQDAEEGFWKYVGDCRGRSSGCSVQTRYVEERMALYDICKNSSAPGLPN